MLKIRKMATNLPHDVIIAILLLLPAKTLVRLKSTCKSWLSSIESQAFIKTHHDLQIINNQDKKILFATSTSEVEEEYRYYDIIEKSNRVRKSLVEDEIDFLSCSKLPKKYMDESACIEYMSSCHGLVFMVIFDGRMILWNPTTGKHHQIPPYKHNDPVPWVSIISGLDYRLNYYHSHLGPAYCFGYDSSVDDYKILRLKREFNNNPIYVDMYSVNKQSWTTLAHLPSDWLIPPNHDPIMFGGAFHFLSHPVWTNTGVPIKESLSSCRWVEEKEKISHVHVPEVAISYKNLCIVQQMLSVSGFTRVPGYRICEGASAKFEVWSVMNNGKNCTRTYWTRTISIQLEFPKPNVVGWLDIRLARFVAEREVLLVKIEDCLLFNKGYLIYDTRKQQFLKIMGYPRRAGDTIGFPRCGIAIDHVETLVSPYPPHQIV